MVDLNIHGYKQILLGDIKVLEKSNIPKLEKEHILSVLIWSVRILYSIHWQPISEMRNERNADNILVKTESGKIFRFMDDLPFEIITHFMLLE